MAADALGEADLIINSGRGILAKYPGETRWCEPKLMSFTCAQSPPPLP
jgi:hypothetical protein